MTQPTEESAVLDAPNPSDATETHEDRSKSSLGEIMRTVFYALLIAIIFRTVLFQPFSIPSGSMKPTLLIGDYLFVSKYSYGYSRFSLPWGSHIPSDWLGGRVFASDPERGDVIVFRNPQDPQEDYIKRLIGLPGDRIRVVSGILHVNGEPVAMERIEDFVEPRAGSQNCNRTEESFGRAAECVKEQFLETLPGGVSHSVLNVTGMRTPYDNTPVFVVPNDHYFFMGDNRDNSVDSRALDSLGMVPEEYLIGRAEFILLSSDGGILEFWNWRFDRFFKAIE